MGYVSGWMYLGAGVVGLAGTAVPSLRYHPLWQLALGTAVIVYGALTLADLLRWGARPMWSHVLAMTLALPIVALGVWATGGPHSYMLPLLLLAPIHWAFFLDRSRTVALLCVGLVAAMWAPFLDSRVHSAPAELSSLAMRSITVCVLAAAVAVIRKRLRAAEASLREQSRLDPLTGLLNRRGFTSELTRLLERTPPHGHRPMLIVLDLDDLKRINDLHGHPAGDQALRVFTQRLSASLRRDDIAARLGGDEFAVAGLVPDQATACEVADRLATAVCGQLDLSPPVRIAATAGWALLEEGELASHSTAATLLAQADRCLLANKQRRLLSMSQSNSASRVRGTRTRKPPRGPAPEERSAVRLL
jgi:diguanylate cyclase (GGDEF)-like protein